jgi:hypothetical protein
MDEDESLMPASWERQMPGGGHSKVPVQDVMGAVVSDLGEEPRRLAMQKASQIPERPRRADRVLTAAAGGSQATRFERFIIQASGSAGGMDYP